MKTQSLTGFFIAFFLIGTTAPGFAMIGQLQTKRERLKSEAAASGFSASAYEKIQERFLWGDHREAERLAGQYFGGNFSRPKADEVARIRALSLIKLGRYDEARELLTQIQEKSRSPELKASAAVSIGDAYFYENRPADAYARYEEALKKYPSSEETPYLLYRLLEAGTKSRLPAEKTAPYRKRLLTEFAASPQAKDAALRFDAAQEALPPQKLPLVPAVPLKQAAMEEVPFYSVQVGSFRDQRNARALLNRLEHYQYDAYLDDKNPDGMLRVKVGRLSTRSEASVLETRLKKDGYPTKIHP